MEKDKISCVKVKPSVWLEFKDLAQSKGMKMGYVLEMLIAEHKNSKRDYTN